jgi:hypothetical protein
LELTTGVGNTTNQLVLVFLFDEFIWGPYAKNFGYMPDQEQSQQVTWKGIRIGQILHANLSYFFVDANSL